MHALICGDGPMGRAIADALCEEGDTPRLLGRPAGGAHDPSDLADAEVVFEFSTAASVRPNVEAALDAGRRRFVIGTTGWTDDSVEVERALTDAGAAAVVAPSFSPAVAVFLRLTEEATRRLAAVVPAYDPYLIEWHRAGKRDRPSGTALEVARRVIAAHPVKTRIAAADHEGPAAPNELAVLSLRAGSSPGEHTLGFDGPGETLELRITARSRRAYADGALIAARWLLAADRTPGIHTFDTVVNDLS